MPDETHNYLVNFETRYTEALQGIQQVTEGLQLFSQILRQTQPLSFQAAEGIRILTLETERLTEAMLRQAQVPGPGVRMEYFARGDAPPWGGVPYTTGAMDRPFPARTWADFQQQQYGANIGGPPRQTTQYYEAYTPTTPVPPEPATTAVPQQTTRYYEMSQAMKYYTDETRVATTVQDEFGQSVQRTGGWLGGYIERYLIRYFVVWQGMVAIRTTIRDWIQAHEDMATAIYRVQGAMSVTTGEAERYMGTLAGIGAGIGVPATQLLPGALQAGGEMATTMARFGQVTGMGAQESIQFFLNLQREGQLTNEQLEQVMASMFALWESGRDIGDITSNWRELLGVISTGPELVDRMNDRFREFGEQGLDTTDKLNTAWNAFLGSLGNTGWMTSLKTGLAGVLQDYARAIQYAELPQAQIDEWARQYEAETGQPATVGAGGRRPRPGFEEWMKQQEPKTTDWGIGGREGAAMIRPSREEAIREAGLTAVAGFAGVMQRPEYERLATRVEALQAEWVERGIIGTEATKSFWVTDKMGGDVERLKAYAEVIAIATSEMNERQKSAVWNWPGGAPMIIMPEALGSVGATTMIQGASRGGGGGDGVGGDSTWSPHPIDWTNPWRLTEYQHGGTVKETGPAFLHQGETVLPADQPGKIGQWKQLPGGGWEQTYPYPNTLLGPFGWVNPTGSMTLGGEGTFPEEGSDFMWWWQRENDEWVWKYSTDYSSPEWTNFFGVDAFLPEQSFKFQRMHGQAGYSWEVPEEWKGVYHPLPARTHAFLGEMAQTATIPTDIDEYTNWLRGFEYEAKMNPFVASMLWQRYGQETTTDQWGRVWPIVDLPDIPLSLKSQLGESKWNLARAFEHGAEMRANWMLERQQRYLGMGALSYGPIEMREMMAHSSTFGSLSAASAAASHWLGQVGAEVDIPSTWPFVPYYSEAEGKFTTPQFGLSQPAYATPSPAASQSWGLAYGLYNWPQYQYGGTVPGPVGQPQPAIVHGGETITPAGQQSAMMPPVLLKTQIDVDGRKVAESTHYLLGDRYAQASRAAFGSGGLVSL